jgi:hypothetical protein
MPKWRARKVREDKQQLKDELKKWHYPEGPKRAEKPLTREYIIWDLECAEALGKAGVLDAKELRAAREKARLALQSLEADHERDTSQSHSPDS